MTTISTSNSNKDDRHVPTPHCSFWRVGLVAGGAIAHAATNTGKYSGEFWIYGGSAGDTTEPTSKDAKVHLTITGPLAVRMFRDLGPRAREKDDVCPSNYETRSRRDLVCERDMGDDTIECRLGFDLRSGAYIRGGMTIC